MRKKGLDSRGELYGIAPEPVVYYYFFVFLENFYTVWFIPIKNLNVFILGMSQLLFYVVYI